MAGLKRSTEARKLQLALGRFQALFVSSRGRSACVAEAAELWRWWKRKTVEERGYILASHESDFITLAAMLMKAHVRHGGTKSTSRRTCTVKFTVFYESVPKAAAMRGRGGTPDVRRKGNRLDRRTNPNIGRPLDLVNSLLGGIEDPFSVTVDEKHRTAWGDALRPEPTYAARVAWEKLISSLFVAEAGQQQPLAFWAASLLEDVEGLQRILEDASNGRCFQGRPPSAEACEGALVESAWLASLAECSLGELLANKIEMLLWRGWYRDKGQTKGERHTQATAALEQEKGLIWSFLGEQGGEAWMRIAWADAVRQVLREGPGLGGTGVPPSSPASAMRMVELLGEAVFGLDVAGRWRGSLWDPPPGSLGQWTPLRPPPWTSGCAKPGSAGRNGPACLDGLLGTPLLLVGTVQDWIRRRWLENLRDRRVDMVRLRLLASLEGGDKEAEPQPRGREAAAKGANKKKEKRKKRKGQQRQALNADEQEAKSSEVRQMTEEEPAPIEGRAEEDEEDKVGDEGEGVQPEVERVLQPGIRDQEGSEGEKEGRGEVGRDGDEWIVVGSRGHVATVKPRLNERKADTAETSTATIKVSLKGKAEAGKSHTNAVLQDRPPQQEQRESSSATKAIQLTRVGDGKGAKDAGSDGENSAEPETTAVPEEGVDILAEQLIRRVLEDDGPQAPGHEGACSPLPLLLSHNQTVPPLSGASPVLWHDEQQALPPPPDLAWGHSFTLRDDGGMGLYTLPLLDVMAGAGLSIGGSALPPSWRPLAQDRRFTGPWSLFSEYNGSPFAPSIHTTGVLPPRCVLTMEASTQTEALGTSDEEAPSAPVGPADEAASEAEVGPDMENAHDRQGPVMAPIIEEEAEQEGEEEGAEAPREEEEGPQEEGDTEGTQVEASQFGESQGDVSLELDSASVGGGVEEERGEELPATPCAGATGESQMMASVRDLCLRLEAEAASLRAALASVHSPPEVMGRPSATPYVPAPLYPPQHFMHLPGDFHPHASRFLPQSLPSHHGHDVDHMEIMSDDGRGGTGLTAHRLPTGLHATRSSSSSSFTSAYASPPMHPRAFPHHHVLIASSGDVPPPLLPLNASAPQSSLAPTPVASTSLRRMYSDVATPPGPSRLSPHPFPGPTPPPPHEGGGPQPHDPSLEHQARPDVWHMCPGFRLTPSHPLPLRSRLCDDVVLFVTSVLGVNARRFPQQASAMGRIRHVVQSLWPRAQVKAYGSFVTGLALPSSDVDLVICLPKVRKDAPAEAPGALEGRNAIKETWQQELARRLRVGSWIDPRSIKIIAHTAVPVIKVRTRATPSNSSSPNPQQQQQQQQQQLPSQPVPGQVPDEPVTSAAVGVDVPLVAWRCLPSHVDMDISFEGTQHNGLSANRVVRGLIDESPAVRPLTLVLKQFMCERGLLESYSGGLSAYGLVLLVACFVQEQQVQGDTGALLMGFLDFYGNHFNPRTTGVSVGRRCFFSREQALGPQPMPHQAPALPRGYYGHVSSTASVSSGHPQHHHPQHRLGSSAAVQHHVSYRFDPLYIEDPMCPSNNVGRNCFRVFQIQRAFSEAWQTLHDCLMLPQSMAYPRYDSFGEEGEDDGSEHAEEIRRQMPLLGRILSCRVHCPLE